MNRPFWLLVLLAFGVGAYLSSPAEPAFAASVVLTPPNGDAPTVSGSLSGDGFYCGTTPWTSDATVTGSGVIGSATITRGSASGWFEVTGSPGASVLITVKATVACPGIGPPQYPTGTATFHFNAAPTATATRTATPLPPTSTPTPTPAPALTWTPTPAPALTWTPTPAPADAPTWTPTPAATPGQPTSTPTPASTEEPPPQPATNPTMGTINLVGCDPPSDEVQVELAPVISDAPSLLVPVVKSGRGTYRFALPEAEPGTLFVMGPKVDDPDCQLEKDDTKYWMSGQKEPNIYAVLGGGTVLRILDKGSQEQPCDAYTPKEQAIGCWGLTEDIFGDMQKLVQLFKWSSELKDVTKAVLQVSALPFPNGVSQDLLAPPDLLTTWDVTCLACEFPIELKVIAPPEPPAKESALKKTGKVVFAPFKAVGKGASTGYKAIKDLIGFGGGAKEVSKPATATKGNPSALGSALAEGKLDLPVPRMYYFRLVPLTETGEAAGAPSNQVLLRWLGKQQPSQWLPIFNCPPGTLQQEGCPTPKPAPEPFKVEIVSYNPLTPPLVAEGCFVVTKPALAIWAGHYHAASTPLHAVETSLGHPYFKGDVLCAPEPEEEECGLDSWDSFTECIEEGFEALEDVVNWASEAYEDAKDYAVDFIVKYTPLGWQCQLVEKYAKDQGADPGVTCHDVFKAGLEGAMASLGIPPSLPNMDQLKEEGLDYLASKAVEEIGIPPEAIQKAKEEGGIYAGLGLEAIEAKLKEEAKAVVKDGLEKALDEMALSYAGSGGWLPYGIPVRPDGWTQPGIIVKITRDGSVPFKCPSAGLSLNVSSFVSNTFSDQAQKKIVDAWNASLPQMLKPGLIAGQQYQFYLGAARSVPCLANGESVSIPIVLQPAKTFGAGYGLMLYADEAWAYVYRNGTGQFDARVFESGKYAGGKYFGVDVVKTAADKPYP